MHNTLGLCQAAGSLARVQEGQLDQQKCTGFFGEEMISLTGLVLFKM